MAEAVSTDAASGAAAKESKGKHKAPKIELSGAQKAAAVIVALGAERHPFSTSIWSRTM